MFNMAVKDMSGWKKQIYLKKIRRIINT